jgi:PrcB C-terminal
MKLSLIFGLLAGSMLATAQITQPMPSITQPMPSSTSGSLGLGAQGGFSTGGSFVSGLKWSPFTSGVQSNFARPGAWVFGDATAFANTWSRLTGQPAITAPGGIDWFRGNLVLVTSGQKETGGYSVFVANVEDSREGVTIIRAYERQPMPGSYVTEGLTAPWAIVRVPKSVHQVALSLMPAPQPLESFVPIPGHGYGIDLPPCYFDDYWNGNDCWVTQENWYTITDEYGLATYWRRFVSQDVPDVEMDWNRYQLVAIHLGRRPTGGYAARVIGVDKMPDGSARIRLVEETPSRRVGVRAKATSPFTIIKVEKSVQRFSIELVKPNN